MTVDDQILEGVGVTPDIEVDFDVVQFEATGKDSQLDRALQYIRNGQ
jgi:C-terminal processing protease CtpA/Prc